MKQRKRLALILLTIALAFAGACRKNQTANSTAPTSTAPAAPTPEDYHHAEGGTTATGQTTHFKGSIGEKLDLQMKLTRDGEKVMGSYFYQKIGAKIDLRGTIDKDGNVVLEEFDTSGKQTGV